MITKDFMKTIFKAAPQKGSPFVFLYSEKKFE
jgi:hypothetical protein